MSAAEPRRSRRLIHRHSGNQERFGVLALTSMMTMWVLAGCSWARCLGSQPGADSPACMVMPDTRSPRMLGRVSQSDAAIVPSKVPTNAGSLTTMGDGQNCRASDTYSAAVIDAREVVGVSHRSQGMADAV